LWGDNKGLYFVGIFVSIPIRIDDEAKSFLKAVPYFGALDENALETVAREFIARHYKAGELIFLEGDPVAGLHLVAEGLCKVYRLSEGGREHVLAILRPGDSCNEVPVVDGDPNPANLSAIEDSTVWVVSAESLNYLRRQYPVLDDIIIKSLAMRCRQLVQRVYNLSFLSVTGRLAAFLLQQSDEQSELSRRQWTQDQIAAHLGTVREMVGRAFRELQEAELIAIDRHRIEILDKEGLEDLT
jgi:CRP/FNR family transcriptional regulator